MAVLVRPRAKRSSTSSSRSVNPSSARGGGRVHKAASTREPIAPPNTACPDTTDLIAPTISSGVDSRAGSRAPGPRPPPAGSDRRRASSVPTRPRRDGRRPIDGSPRSHPCRACADPSAPRRARRRQRVRARPRPSPPDRPARSTAVHGSARTGPRGTSGGRRRPARAPAVTGALRRSAGARPSRSYRRPPRCQRS